MLRKILITIGIVGVLGAVGGFGAYSAFTATTTNDNNTFASGSVQISDNDANVEIYSVAAAKPGDFEEACVKVTYTGTLPANVKLSRGTVGALGAYVNLKVYKGTGNAMNCTGFADTNGGTPLFDNTLTSMGTDWTGGLALTNASGSATWSQNDTVTYRIRGTLIDDANAQNKSTGLHSFTWEARNT